MIAINLDLVDRLGCFDTLEIICQRKLKSLLQWNRQICTSINATNF